MAAALLAVLASGCAVTAAEPTLAQETAVRSDPLRRQGGDVKTRHVLDARLADYAAAVDAYVAGPGPETLSVARDREVKAEQALQIFCVDPRRGREMGVDCSRARARLDADRKRFSRAGAGR